MKTVKRFAQLMGRRSNEGKPMWVCLICGRMTEDVNSPCSWSQLPGRVGISDCEKFEKGTAPHNPISEM